MLNTFFNSSSIAAEIGSSFEENVLEKVLLETLLWVLFFICHITTCLERLNVTSAEITINIIAIIKSEHFEKKLVKIKKLQLYASS